MTRPNGIYTDITLDEYVKMDRYGASDLRAFRNGSPALMRWQKDNPQEAGSASKIGSAAHCRIITPDLFEKTYALKPAGMTFALKEGKAWRDDPARTGMEILTDIEAQTVIGVEAAFHSKGIAEESLLGATKREATVLWDCATTGLKLKGRPDWFDGETVYDLKVSRHAEIRSSLPFRAYMEGWMNQLASNRAGLNAVGVPVHRGRLIVIAPKPPQQFRVWCLTVKEQVLDLLELENEKTRAEIKRCEESGIWPSTPDEWEEIEPPAAAMVDMIGAVDFSGAEEE